MSWKKATKQPQKQFPSVCSKTLNNQKTVNNQKETLKNNIETKNNHRAAQNKRQKSF